MIGVSLPIGGEAPLRIHAVGMSYSSLLPEHWPNQAGKVMEGAHSVKRVVGQHHFPIENFDTGYCLQGCETRVAPGEKTSASVSYDGFKLPAALETEPKSLDFPPLRTGVVDKTPQWFALASAAIRLCSALSRMPLSRITESQQFPP